MVNALVEIGENTNRVLNIVKARFGLKNKGEAVDYVVKEYVEFEGEPELRPEFVEKMLKQQSEPTVKVKDFNKHFGLK